MVSLKLLHQTAYTTQPPWLDSFLGGKYIYFNRVALKTSADSVSANILIYFISASKS